MIDKEFIRGNASMEFNDGLNLMQDGESENAEKLWYEIAKKGDSNAQFYLWYMAYNDSLINTGKGFGIKTTVEEEFKEFLISSASQGHSMAQNCLGSMYLDEEFSPEEKGQSIKWFKLSAEQGELHALGNLGRIYLEGDLVDKDVEESFNCYKKCSDKDFPPGQNGMGIHYWKGLAVSKDVEKAIKYFSLASENGYTGGDINLGRLYREMAEANDKQEPNFLDFREKNIEKATECFLRAIEEKYTENYYDAFGALEELAEPLCYGDEDTKFGNAAAQNALGKRAIGSYNHNLREQKDSQNMGSTVSYDDEISSDIREAEHFFSLASDQGHSDAQYHLGQLYLGQERIEKGIELITLSAEQGHTHAQNVLAMMYGEGIHKEQDYFKAFQWLKKSAEQGDSDAQYNLGRYYDHGRGVTKSLNDAFHWYHCSAKQNNSLAMYNVGNMYLNGEGTEKNIVLAYKWVSLATLYEHPNLSDDMLRELHLSLGKIINDMNPEQIKEGKKLISKWEKENE